MFFRAKFDYTKTVIICERLADRYDGGSITRITKLDSPFIEEDSSMDHVGDYGNGR
jgi:hypothetical protein